MLDLAGSQTGSNLEHALSNEGRADRIWLIHQQTAEAAGYRDLATVSRAAAKTGARYASGHLDFLGANDDPMKVSTASREDLTTAMSARFEEQTAMFAGMTRTAREDGFEDIADWFETLAKAGRSRARRSRSARIKPGFDS
jgi:rubrerythrin